MIATNDSYREIAMTRSGKRADEVTVVRTGPDLQRLQPGEADPELRRGRRFLVAYIGVMGPQDGVDIVVRAADIVVNKLGRDDIAFTLIGSGDCFDDLVALRDELGLAGHVEFTGRAPDELVARIMSTADVGLSPDPKNPLNDVSTMNKTMEYMAFELPVVAFDLRETRVSAGDAAVYVQPNDEQQYAEAIVALMDDEPRRALDGEAGPGTGRAGAGLEPPGTRLPRRLRSACSAKARPASGRGPDMCGIAGCYQQADGHKLVDIMTDRIAHRGPDAAGIWSHEDDRVSVHLGHRRLSIIDLSAAADQPLSKDGLTLVYNGELYNYRELRAELAGRGVRFTTELRHRGRARGLAPLGAQAPAQVPRHVRVRAGRRRKTGELFLARDPLGIKPLYYLPRGDGALFASELKALIAAVGPELRIEPGALVASMLYYWVPEQCCAIEGVRKLPAGSWARLAPGRPPPGRAVLERRRRGPRRGQPDRARPAPR